MSASVCACLLLCVCVCSVFYLLGSCIVWVQRQHSPGSDLYKAKVAEISHHKPHQLPTPSPLATTALHQAEIVATWVSSNVSSSSSSSSYSSTISYCCFCCVCLVYGFLFLSIFEQSKLRATIKKITKKNKKKIPWHVMCSSYVCG